MAMLALFDMTGLLLRWRSLDHAGHLGGLVGALTMCVLFGLATDFWPRWIIERLQL
jgi:hypothetical protein